MQMRAVVGLLGMLAGCAETETAMGLAYGQVRAEPHPVHRDSIRIVTAVPVALIELDPLRRAFPEGQRTVVTTLLGPECAQAQIVDEGRVRIWTGRQEMALRVICPAALILPAGP
jgi:hypothetical protein